MSTRMLARRTFVNRQAAGGDSALGGIWLPPGSRVHEVNGYCNAETIGVLSSGNTCMGSVEGWVFNLDDIDSLGTMDTEFDIHVPKDDPSIDLDVSAINTAPFFEPGEVAWHSIFPIGRQPVRVFRKQWMSATGLNSVLTNQDPESPFGLQFIGGITFPIRINRPFSVEHPSLLVFVLASPDTLETSASDAIAAIGETEWGQLRYIDHVLERAMISLIGLTETGAETPWDEAVTLLTKVLDPKVLEGTVGDLDPVTWMFRGELVFDFSVEGEMKHGIISTGR